jgi:predicted DCC family thiol-disulfide oxidoreductase YuxK
MSHVNDPIFVEKADVVVVYDGQCPVCTKFFPSYLQLLNIGYRVKIIDARTAPQLTSSLLTCHGINIDNDAATWYEGSWYSGDQAISILADIALGKREWKSRLIRRAFRLTYPSLRVGRRALLAILGRSLIQPKRPS